MYSGGGSLTPVCMKRLFNPDIGDKVGKGKGWKLGSVES